MLQRLKKWIVCAALLSALALSGCGVTEPVPTPAPPPSPTPSPTPYVDPFEGLVSVPDGAGGFQWIVESEILPVSDFEKIFFVPQSDGTIRYSGSQYKALYGVDVSVHQKEIDWAAVAASGVEFAMIRLGYRGYGAAGTLNEDEYFRANMEGALNAGLKVGVYFFSQAVNSQEAKEEAAFVLERLEGYELTMPVAYDWEPITYDEASRTKTTPGGVVTNCAVIFCEAVKAAGYEPMVYFYRGLGYHIYDLDRLADYPFWVGALGDYPDFYYKHAMWQYSITGQVPGISGDTDLDIWFEPVKKEQSD